MPPLAEARSLQLRVVPFPLAFSGLVLTYQAQVTGAPIFTCTWL